MPALLTCYEFSCTHDFEFWCVNTWVAWWLSSLVVVPKAGRLQEILGLKSKREHQQNVYIIIEMSSVALMTLKLEGWVVCWLSGLAMVPKAGRLKRYWVQAPVLAKNASTWENMVQDEKYLHLGLELYFFPEKIVKSKSVSTHSYVILLICWDKQANMHFKDILALLIQHTGEHTG